MMELSPHQLMSNAIRALAMDAVEHAKSGHPGMPMGMADVATVLFQDFLKFDPTQPEWPDRDRFVLSAGHGSMLLYSLLYLTGYPDMTIDELKRFRQLGSRTAGHPEFGDAPGIETTTGPLGQGLGNAVGMALGESLMAARYGAELVNHHTYVIASDGDLMEGISHEAISLAGHLRLRKLIVLFDDNSISIDGSTALAVSDDQVARFKACGWSACAIDGHDPTAIAAAIKAAHTSDKPSFIACKTMIAYGAPKKAGTSGAHGAPLGDDEIEATRQALHWPYPPFVIPEDSLKLWRQPGERGRLCYQQWQDRLNAIPVAKKTELERVLAKKLPPHWKDKVNAFIEQILQEQPNQATRQLSGRVLETLTQVIPELIGGSADLTGSVNTKTKSQNVVTADDYSGSYIHYGVREHAMAAVMNGLSLHGFIPYGGTFLIFSDYLKPALRLSALMKQQVIYVLTHDSIGLGEDGPTHQPIEQLAGLRAIPNLNVFRPADGVEVAECWMLALENQETPSVMALTRQSLPPARFNSAAENLSSRGAYILKESKAPKRMVTLLATGSEVTIALEAQHRLEKHGIATAVVSMPCWRLFEQQPAAYRNLVLDPQSLRIAIEAASTLGWDRYIGEDGIMIGMHGFGASAPASDLYRHFGITSDAVVEVVLKKHQEKR